MIARMGENERLRQEIEIGEASRRELQVPGTLVALLRRDQHAHGAHVGRNLGGLAAAGDDLGDRARDRRAERLVAADHARAGERHVLPQLGLGPLIGDEALELRGERALAAVRA